MKHTVKGLRVAALAADGFEQIELTRPLKALEKAGAVVEVVSLRKGHIQGMNLLVPGRRVKVDRTLKEADPALYDALLLPGGHISPDFLRQSKEALAFVRAFDEAEKPIAVICHGPWVLASAGLVEGRRLTSWPNIKDDIINAGGIWEDAPAVRDRNWVSSRGPQDLPAFEKAMLELYSAHTPLRPHQLEQERRRGGAGSWLAGSLLAAGVGYALTRLRGERPGAEAVLGGHQAAPADKPL